METVTILMEADTVLRRKDTRAEIGVRARIVKADYPDDYYLPFPPIRHSSLASWSEDNPDKKVKHRSIPSMLRYYRKRHRAEVETAGWTVTEYPNGKEVICPEDP